MGQPGALPLGGGRGAAFFHHQVEQDVRVDGHDEAVIEACGARALACVWGALTARGYQHDLIARRLLAKAAGDLVSVQAGGPTSITAMSGSPVSSSSSPCGLEYPPVPGELEHHAEGPL